MYRSSLGTDFDDSEIANPEFAAVFSFFLTARRRMLSRGLQVLSLLD